MARNRTLALEAGGMLMSPLGTEVAARPAMAGSMAAIRRDLPGPATREAAVALPARLLAAGTDAPVAAVDGGFWLRISAAAYNGPADYEQPAMLLAATL